MSSFEVYTFTPRAGRATLTARQATALVLLVGLIAVQRPGLAMTARGGAFAPGGDSAAVSAPEAVQSDWSFGTAAFAYTSQASGNADLWLSTGPMGESTNLTAHPAQDHWASWFPDGERLAFQTLRDGNREVYLMNADGSGLVNLTDDPAQDLLPTVSPDGSRILFFSDRGIEHGPRELPGHLYVMDADGANVERLTAEPLTSTFFGDWSPDGRTIVLARSFAGDVDLVLLDRVSGDEERLPGTEASEYGARFSPDGRWLAFHASRESGEARIVVMRVDGSERRDVTTGAQHYDPRWSPDGRWLLITGAPIGATQFDVMVVSVAGGQVRPLVATEVDERSGSWRPARGTLRAGR
jgi:TolB protein